MLSCSFFIRSSYVVFVLSCYFLFSLFSLISRQFFFVSRIFFISCFSFSSSVDILFLCYFSLFFSRFLNSFLSIFFFFISSIDFSFIVQYESLYMFCDFMFLIASSVCLSILFCDVSYTSS